MLFVVLLFVVGIVMGVGLLVYGNKHPIKNNESEYSNSFNKQEKVTHLKDVYEIDNIYDGIIYKHNQCLVMATVEGINFTVLSEVEQNSRESAIIETLMRLEYPIRFITNTVVVDTSEQANHIAHLANETPDGDLQIYRTLYAGALEQMRIERSVLTQQTYIVIPGNTSEEVKTRLSLLTSAFAENASIIITPLQTSDDVYDAIQNIVMPEKIVKASEIVASGVLEPVHFHEKEVVNFVQKENQKQAETQPGA